MKAQQLAAELEVEMMADMYNRYEALMVCMCNSMLSVRLLAFSISDVRKIRTCVVDYATIE